MYHERRPLAPALVPLVERIWWRRGDAGPEPSPHRVLPDGCMDVLFELEGRGGVLPRPAAVVVGAMTAPLDVRQAGPVDIVGVRFRPGAAPAFVDVPAGELTDATLPLDAAWGPRADATWGRLAETREPAARVALLEAALLDALLEGEARLDRVVLHACRAVAEAPGSPVDAAVRATRLGRRQLERRFRAAVGLPPGVAGRVQRFRRALRLLSDRPDLPLARVALGAGYYDQPHMTREFAALAGESPGRWRRAVAARVASVQDPGDSPP